MSREIPRDRVLLVYPPFGCIDCPSMGLGLLKSILRRDGIASDVAYLNFDFLDLIPGEPLERKQFFDSVSSRNEYFLGDWIFNGAVFEAPEVERLDDRFVDFLRSHRQSDAVIERAFEVKSIVPAFLDHAMASVDWASYRIVGFHSTFSQTMACLALARRVKEAHPGVVTIFGGPNAEDTQGTELLRQFPWMDYAFQGEADGVITSLFAAMLSPEPLEANRFPGLIYRTGKSDARGLPVVVANPVDMVQDMDSLPYPDFDEFFDRVWSSREYEGILPTYNLMETSRGCWWGVKHHCTFCGFNSKSFEYRSKSPDRVMEELRFLVDRYRNPCVKVVDNILDMTYFKTFFPRLKDSDLAVSLYFEVKANLSREHIDLMADCGTDWILPGIESLSTEVLRIMDKGCSYLQNVAFLKYAAERDMTVFWAILYGFPGETWQNYLDTRDRMQALMHLHPPKFCTPIRVDRFSVYYKQPEPMGMTRIYPSRAYEHVYPFDEDVRFKLAYQFQYDYADRDPELNRRIPELLTPGLETWLDRFFFKKVSLLSVESPTRVLVRDDRAGAVRYHLLSGVGRDLYLACDKITSVRQMERMLERGAEAAGHDLMTSLFGGLNFEEVLLDRCLEHARRLGCEVVEHASPSTPDELAAFLRELGAALLMAHEEDRWLNLACRARERLSKFLPEAVDSERVPEAQPAGAAS